MYNINQLPQKLATSEANTFEYYANGKKKVLRFKEVYNDVAKVASWLQGKGVRKGDRVGLLGRNSYEWVVIDLACLLGGIVTIPFETTRKHVVGDLVADFKLAWLLTSVEEEIAAGHPRVISFERAMKDSKNCRVRDWREFQPGFGGGDVFTVISTSGTAGRSKFIEIKAKSFGHLLDETQTLYGFEAKDRFLVFLPLSVYLERCYVYSAILVGFSVILTPPEFVFHSIQNDKPTVTIGIPYFFETFHNRFLERIREKWLYRMAFSVYLGLKRAGLGFLFGNRFAPFTKAWGCHIRYLLTGSAPIRKETLVFYREMGITLYEGYGMSEIGGMVALNAPGRVKLGSVGKPFPGKDVWIDETGQIMVRSSHNANTRYLRSTREENERTYLSDGTVATGDLGYFDDDGYLYINGRKKDLIVTSSGKKVHPTYVEEKIIDSGLFSNCMVFGDDKPFLVALVVPKNQGTDHERIKKEFARINAGLAKEEQVLRFHVHSESFTVDNGFLTPTLKSNRPRISSVFANQLNQLYNS